MATKAKSKPRRRKLIKKTREPLVRTSERSTFNTCRQQWWWGYVERLTPIREKPALRFGTLVHKALELRYPPGVRRGPHPAETFEKVYEQDLKDADEKWGFKPQDGSEEGEEWAEALDIGVDMLEMFVEKYGKDEEWRVIESEMTFQVPVVGPDGEEILFWYVGTMDGVWENRMDGSIRIIDWKTTKNNPEKEGGLKALDEQATAYWTWGCDWLMQQGILRPKQMQVLNGMEFTFLRKGKRDARPQNEKGQYLNKHTDKQKREGLPAEVSQKQPLPYFHRETVYRGEEEKENARIRAIQQFDEMQKVRDGRMVVYKSPNTGSMGHCNWCDFKDICELHEVGSDWQELLIATTTEWDPYSAHEIQEEGKR